jgi:superkiller protein 3
MRSFLLSLVVVAAALGVACSGSTTEPDPNANAAPESPFAAIVDANQALAEGNRLLDENQTEMAIAAYHRAIELNPDLAEAHFQLGIAWSLVEMRASQEGSTDQADSKKPNSLRSFERAVEAYKKWIADNPKDDVAYFNLGRTYSKLLKDEQAEDAFKHAVRLKPDETEYQTELGAVLIKLAKYHEAIGPLNKAIELDPTNARAIDMLEDAQAGRQRIDFVGPKKDANANANKAANANANAAANSNANTSTRPPPATNARPSPTRRP